MPVLIQEVIIRVTVAEQQTPCSDTPAVPAGTAAASGTSDGRSNEQMAELIFEILKAKKER